MNHETDIALSLKRKYGYRGELGELIEQVTHVVVVFETGGVERIPALDDLVDVVRDHSGRARRADINTVTRTVFSLFEGSPERGVEAI